ncbi:MAG TPA: hypothetical protein VM370_11370 [Candidatus Thermoplasmatota archaeon]|nr:hypothetical protein [Candidatus Thermoplasmatota archaeon]
MSRPNTPARLVIALAIVAIFLAPLALPMAAALPGPLGAPAPKRSVGTFAVAPVGGSPHEGKATGSVTSAIINEAGASAAGSVIKSFTINGGSGADAAETVFDSIDVEGFQPTSKLEGVGTSSLGLKSEDLVIGMTDSANSLLTFRATGSAEQRIVFNAAADVVMTASGAASNVWDVRGEGTSGVLILVQAAGQQATSGGSSLQLAGQHKAVATLKHGTELIYRANANYASSAAAAADESASAYNEAAVKAVANGKLAGEATSEFSTGVSLIAQANFFATAQTKTTTDAAKRVTTTLRSEVQASACAAGDAAANGAGSAAGTAQNAAGSAAGSASAAAKANVCAQIVAYDLDYVDLPAATAENVAVYINGALAQRVDAASKVAAHADSYWATTVEGRVLVLTNVAAKANAATQITLAALADAQATATTLAELDAMSEITAQLEGGYSLLGNLETSVSGQGQVVGSFGAFFANEAKGAAEIRDFTDIRSATEIFAKMHFAADVAADASAQMTSTAQASAAGSAYAAAKGATHAGAKFVTMVDGSALVQTEFTDDVYAAFIAEAEAATQVDLSLSNDIGATFVGDAEDVIALDGPAGQVGHLMLVHAQTGAQSASKLDLSVPGHVKANLDKGERIVYRSATEHQARAHADAAAQAIADGTLASEATVGFVANAVASANVDWSKDIHLAIDKAAEHTHKGLVTTEAYADAAVEARAHAFALVADRATLAARSADDIIVSVDGQLATAVETAADVYASTEAAYYVLASLQGQTYILFSVPSMAAGEAHQVAIASTADAEARLKSALDVFGSFEPGYGGVADGDVVNLIAKPDAGLLLDYSVTARGAAKDALEATGFAAGALDQTTTVFDAIKIGESAFATGSASTSNSVRFVSDEAIVEAFDVSSGTLKIRAIEDTIASLDLADNIEATPVNDGVILLSAPDFSGALILSSAHSAEGAAEAAFSVSGDAVTAQLGEGSQLIFKAFSGFEAELSQADQLVQANAIAAGNLLGQVIVDTAAGATAFTTTTANINYYDDVKAITSAASSDAVSVVVDSATHAGKTLIISFDRDTVQGLIDGDAILMVDGVAVKQAKSYEDAFVADGDKYWLITSDGEVGLQAIVTLAHFSTRTITIASPEAPSVFLWTTIALGIVVVGQIVYPRIRKNRSG